jgi:signal transduction histidine kinase
VDTPFETIRKRRLGLSVLAMVGVILLQLVSEYLGTRDSARFLLKSAALAVGIPLLILWASAVFRWASVHRVGALVPLFVGPVVSGVVFALLLLGVGEEVPALHPTYGPWGRADLLRVGFSLGITCFAIWALAFVFPFAAEDARLRALEAQKLSADVELAHLRSHLEPHFLLNTLNAISGLVTEDPREARRLLGVVGDLLRDLVAPGREMETVEEQLEWLRRYATILETRHAGHLRFRWQMGAGTGQALLPRLLLQPLVENAVKHGALMRPGGGEVGVRTELGEGARLICTIEDNGPGIEPGPTRPGAFGVSSVHRRLALRYAGAASLANDSSAKGTSFVVTLPLEQEGRS